MLQGDLLIGAGVVWSYLMWCSRWLTGISPSGRSSAARLSRLSSLAMGFILDLERVRRRNCYRVLEGRKMRENEKQFQIQMCLRLSPLVGIYSHEGEMVDILERVKANPINGRGSVALLITRGTRHWWLRRNLKGFYNKGHFQIQLSQSKVRIRSWLM